VTALGLSMMLASVELIDKLEDFRQRDALSLIKFFILVLPQYVAYAMPVSGLFAGLFTAGQAVKSRETVAVMSAGGRLTRLFLPLAGAGIFLSLLGFALGEFIVPAGLQEARAMRTGAAKSLFRGGTVWLRADDGSLVRFGLYIKEQRAARGVSIFRFAGGRLSERVDAEEASLADGSWVLKKVKLYGLREGSVKDLPSTALPASFIEPEVIEKGAKKTEEMNFGELREYIVRLRAAGIKSLRLSVDLHSKLSYPFVNLFLVLLAVSLSLRSGLGGFASISLGVAVSLVYWLAYTMSLSLGYAGIFPPVVAAWAAPILFAGISVWLYTGIKE
jgi:lipopolysaccharide export system permease protein